MKNSIFEPRGGTVDQVRGHHKGSVYDELRPRLQNHWTFIINTQPP